MPTTWLGRFVAAAILVTEIDEVLVARIASVLAMPSSSREQLQLQVDLLERRLDDEVAVGHGVERRPWS